MWIRHAIAVAVVATALSGIAVAGTEPSRCEVTGKPRWQCCPRKSSPMPPCCQSGCSTGTRVYQRGRLYVDLLSWRDRSLYR